MVPPRHFGVDQSIEDTIDIRALKEETFLVLTLPKRHDAHEHSIRYRPEADTDTPFLTTLYRSTRETELSRTGWDEEQKAAFIVLQFRAQYDHYKMHYPDALWLIIEQNGARIGRLYLERWTHEHRIIDIALVPSARGKGIGTAILRDLMSEAREAGKSLSIHVEKENPAMTLYRRLGFETLEDKGVYDLMEWAPSDRDI